MIRPSSRLITVIEHCLEGDDDGARVNVVLNDFCRKVCPLHRAHGDMDVLRLGSALERDERETLFKNALAVCELCAFESLMTHTPTRSTWTAAVMRAMVESQRLNEQQHACVRADSEKPLVINAGYKSDVIFKSHDRLRHAYLALAAARRPHLLHAC